MTSQLGKGAVIVAPERERELISRSQAGEVAAFNELVLAYQGRVYNLALRMLSSVEAAEDATQDTFVSAFRGIGRFRGGNFQSWLLRIAANACRDQLRSRRRRPSTSLEAIILDEENPRDFPTEEESPADYAERRELGEAIGRGLDSLPPDQRLVVILSDVQGLSYSEIAQVTETNLGTVKSRLSRGRAQLRDYLRRETELLPERYRLKD